MLGMCRCASEHAHWHASGGTRPAGMQWAWMTRTLAGLEMRRPGPSKHKSEACAQACWLVTTSTLATTSSLVTAGRTSLSAAPQFVGHPLVSESKRSCQYTSVAAADHA